MISSIKSFVAAWVILAVVCIATARADDVYYVNQLWTGNGKVIKDAAVVVADGKITAVGTRAEIGDTNAKPHELGNASLVPGLVIAETTLAESGRDEEEALTPEIRVADGFDYYGEYDQYLASGITTVQLSPGRARIMPGQGAVVKLAGDDSIYRTLADSESLRILLTQAAFNPPRIYEPPVGAVSVERPLEPTRPQLAGNLADAIVGLRALLTASGSDAAGDDVLLSKLGELLASNLPVRITAKSAGEILAATQLGDEFQLPFILVDADGIDSVKDGISWSEESLRGIILRTGNRPGRLIPISIPGVDEVPDAEPWQRVAAVVEKGALDRLAITANDADLEDIWFLASSLRAADISEEQLLDCLTSNAAKLLRVDDRVGSIEPGKDADMVLLSGTPFESDTRVLATFVDGAKVFDRAASTKASVIRADYIQTPDGLVKGGLIAIEGKKIRGMGRGASYPVDAEVQDFPGCVIVPGFVDLATEVGVGGSFGDRLTLNTEIGELLVSDDKAVALARQGGVTTGLLSSSNLPSPVIAFKLSDKPRVLKDPVAIRYRVSGNLTSEEAKLKQTLETAKKYVDSWNEYDEAYAKYKKELATYEQAKAKYDAAVAAKEKAAEEAKKKAEAEKKDASKDGDKPTDGDKPEEKSGEAKEADAKKDADTKTDVDKKSGKDDADKEKAAEDKLVEPKKPDEPKKPRQTSALEPYRLLFAGKIGAIVEVGDGNSLELATKLFVDEYGLRTTLAVSGTSYREAAKLAGKKVSIVVHPPLEVDEDGKPVNLAERFLAVGLKVAIESRAGTGAKRLPDAVSYSVYRGLGSDDAIGGLTSIPAELMGLESVGAIAPAKDADLVVFSGMPFDPASRVVAVMIDGTWVYREGANDE